MKSAVLIVSSVFLAAGASSVAAADLIVDVPTIEAATSQWDGAYVGIGGVVESAVTLAPDTVLGVFGNVGYNVTMDSFLLGAEVYLLGWNSSATGPGLSVGGEVRAGYIVSDPVLLYGSLGLEVTNGGNVYALPGAGLEFMVTDNLSFDLEYKWYQPVSGTTWSGHSVWGSLNWHF